MAGTTKTRKTHGERGKYGGTKSVSPFRSRDCRRAKNKSRAARPAAWTRSCHGEKDPKSSADKKESTARRRASVHSDQGTAEPRQRPRCPQNGQEIVKHNVADWNSTWEIATRRTATNIRATPRTPTRRVWFLRAQKYTSNAKFLEYFRGFFPHMMAPADLLRQRKRNRAPQEQASPTCKSSATSSRMLRETTVHRNRVGGRGGEGGGGGGGRGGGGV